MDKKMDMDLVMRKLRLGMMDEGYLERVKLIEERAAIIENNLNFDRNGDSFNLTKDNINEDFNNKKVDPTAIFKKKSFKHEALGNHAPKQRTMSIIKVMSNDNGSHTLDTITNRVSINFGPNQDYTMDVFYDNTHNNQIFSYLNGVKKIAYNNDLIFEVTGFGQPQKVNNLESKIRLTCIQVGIMPKSM